MGNYTNYRADFILHTNTPEPVMEVIRYLLNVDQPHEYRNSEFLQVEQFNHPFFQCRRWPSIGWGGGGMDMQKEISEADRLTRTENGHHRVRISSASKGTEEDLARLLHWLYPWLVYDQPHYSALNGRALVGAAQYEERRMPYDEHHSTLAKLFLVDVTGVLSVMYGGARYEREDFKGVVEVDEGFDILEQDLDDIKLDLVTERALWRRPPDDANGFAVR